MMNHRHIFEVEARKPKSVRATLRRFWHYFGGRRIFLLLVLVMAAFNAWTRVVTPDLIGQTVDCYLTPYTQQELGGSESSRQAAENNCWFDEPENMPDESGMISRDSVTDGVRLIVLLLVQVGGSETMV